MRKALILFVAVILVFGAATAYAEPRADTEFRSASITLSSTGICTYSASTYENKERIEIVQAYLFKKTNGIWECVTDLPVPSYVAENWCSYGASINYYAYMGYGEFRVQALFRADGHDVYRYSNGQIFW